MSEPSSVTEAPERLPCRFCGAPAPQWVSTCLRCGREVNRQAPVSLKSSHFWEIVVAIFCFAATNFVLLATLDSPFPVSPQSLVLRAFWDDRWWPHLVRALLLGPPFLAVLWSWYHLMHETDPDYGRLWGVYLTAQGLTWIAAFLLCVAAVLMIILVSIFLLLTATGR